MECLRLAFLLVGLVDLVSRNHIQSQSGRQEVWLMDLARQMEAAIPTCQTWPMVRSPLRQHPLPHQYLLHLIRPCKMKQLQAVRNHIPCRGGRPEILFRKGCW